MRVRARYVILALLAIPLADAALLLWVAMNLLTAVQTVALVVLTGLVGMLLVRAEGRHTLRSIQEKLARGQPPTDELLDGALLIAAGAFLLTPGVVTDVIGFALALPPTRYPVREVLRRYVLVPAIDERTGGFASGVVWSSGFPDFDGDDGPAGAGAGAGGPGGPGGFGPGGSGAGGGSRGGSASGSGSGAGSTGEEAPDGEEFVDVEFEEVDDDERDDRAG